MRGKIRCAAIFFLVLSAWLVATAERLAAQTETVIDGRNAAAAQFPHDQGAGWAAGVNPDTTLEAHFTIDNPPLKSGQPFNYELLITNTGEKTITLPRSLDWKIVETEDLEQDYVKASVTLELRSKGAFTYITPTLDLYSAPGKPDTLLVLHPGDSLRILGTSTLPMRSGPEWAGPKTLIGHLCMRSVSETFRQTPVGRRSNGARHEIPWCANADEKYEVSDAPGR